MNAYSLSRLLMMSISLFGLACVAVADESDVNASNRPLVIIGASYAASWPIESLGGRPVINHGIDGNQSFEMRQRFAEDVLQQDPAVVLMWGFINDIFRAEAEKMDEAKERIKNSYREMVALAQENEAEVVVATEVSIREQAGFGNWAMSKIGSLLGKTSYQDTINGHVHEVNTWLKDFARREGLKVLDFEALLADSDGKRKSEFAADDGSHLTDAAYAAMTGYATQEMQAD